MSVRILDDVDGRDTKCVRPPKRKGVSTDDLLKQIEERRFDLFAGSDDDTQVYCLLRAEECSPKLKLTI